MPDPAGYDFDEDALIASVDLIGRSGATNFQFAYLHEDAPVEEAGWYAHAQYRGVRIIEEDHRGPLEAVEALARKILTGAMCTHCGGLIALSDRGAFAKIGATMLDGSTMTEERARAMGQCRYRRVGNRWVRGCEDTHPRTPSGTVNVCPDDHDRPRPGPNRASRRAAKRNRGRQ